MFWSFPLSPRCASAGALQLSSEAHLLRFVVKQSVALHRSGLEPLPGQPLQDDRLETSLLRVVKDFTGVLDSLLPSPSLSDCPPWSPDTLARDTRSGPRSPAFAFPPSRHVLLAIHSASAALALATRAQAEASFQVTVRTRPPIGIYSGRFHAPSAPSPSPWVTIHGVS